MTTRSIPPQFFPSPSNSPRTITDANTLHRELIEARRELAQVKRYLEITEKLLDREIRKRHAMEANAGLNVPD